MGIICADKGVQIRRGRRHFRDQNQIEPRFLNFLMLAFLTLVVLGQGVGVGG